MDSSNDIGARLQKLVAAAASGARNEGSFQILGGETKHFLGREPTGASLSVVDHRGIVNYQPKELVITARCGSRLAEIESTLAERDQMLSFEPPHFGPGATLGGAVATGLSGPRRPYAGSTRDFVMGVRILNGRGEMLRFGGEVMKNVAGYDVSRLMVGAMGTLGIILEASLKVTPAPAEEITLIQEHTMVEAITLMNDWAGRPLPLSGSCFHDGRLYARLSGAPGATRPARERLGGESLETTGGDHKGHAGDRGFWRDVREQRHDFFTGMTASEPLWRISVPPACPPLGLSGTWFIEWGGAQRWLRAGPPAREIRKAVSAMGGHVTLFRGGDRGSDVFHPLAPGIAELHGRIKRAFDPHGLFNPGRLYPNL